MSIDGNLTNIELSNLKLVTGRAAAYMSLNIMYEDDPVLNELNMNIALIETTIHKLENGDNSQRVKEVEIGNIGNKSNTLKRRKNKMIKYANIKGYSNIGEVASHLYQWIEHTDDTPKVILVRAYDTETKLWSGYLFNETKTAEYVDVDIKSDMDIGNEADIVRSFKEFLKGHSLEVGFKDFKEVD